MGCPTDALSEAEAAQAAIAAIDRLCADLAIPPRLSAIGARAEQLDEMARLCVEANYNRWNPRHTTLEDFRALFRQAF
jgi:alcohol dehydrogenase